MKVLISRSIVRCNHLTERTSTMFRRYIFKLVDFLKGSPVSKNLADIRAISRNSFDLNGFTAFQEERLNKILRYTKRNVSFYENLPIVFLKLPVLSKLDLRNNLSEFISKEYVIGQLKEVVTSGSTGLPFKVYQSKEKVHRNTADTIVFGEMGGLFLGNKLAYFKIWNNINEKSWWLKRVQNILPVDVLNLSDLRIKKLIGEMNKESNLNFLGYSSALESISACVKRHNLHVDVRLDSIITMSEGIGIEGRKNIQATFNCPVYARYSNVENGIIAQQTSMESDRYLINSASYYVEILDLNEDTPIADGIIGRIVITDFFNKGMPIIRYDTGDMGSKITLEEEGSIKEYLLDVGGRRMDAIYNTKGDLISSFVITNGTWNYAELLQYQFFQKGLKEYGFKLSVETNFEREEALIDEFKVYLGKDALISIEYVNEIPVLASGKRRKVVNLMN